MKRDMKKGRFVFTVLLLCLIFMLSGCKAVVDAQRATEPPAEPEPATEALNARYDLSSPKAASWFDDAVFVGDSVTLKLSYYCASDTGVLGNAEFFCAGSLGYGNALWELDNPEAVHPYYKGAVHLTEECAEVTGKKNVFIMLGMNDIALYGVDDTIKNCRELVDRILKRTPDALIYIQSVTPMIDSVQTDSFNNRLISQLDEKLKTLCEEKDYRYLDVYSALADADGNLPLDYCSDPENMGLHFNDASCKIWADYLKANA